MKQVASYVAAALVMALIGTGCLRAGLLERDLARVEQNVAVMNYDDAEAPYRLAERYLELASHLPLVGSAPVNDIRAREAALHYWQHDYLSIVPTQNDPVTAIAADNVELQFIVANAAYRAAQARATDRQSSMMAIDTGINAYAEVLKNAKRHEDAAYNFEYLVKLRDDVEKGRRRNLSSGNPSPLGSLGFPAKELENSSKFKILVPLDSDDRNKIGNAGKGEPKPRKG